MSEPIEKHTSANKFQIERSKLYDYPQIYRKLPIISPAPHPHIHRLPFNKKTHPIISSPPGYMPCSGMYCNELIFHDVLKLKKELRLYFDQHCFETLFLIQLFLSRPP